MAARPIRRKVLLTQGAVQDLESLHRYLCEFASPATANQVLDRWMIVVQGLAEFPERGSYPRELLALGMKDYRQATFKPYRVIYRVLNERVVLYLVVDGRRDLSGVLARRLLGADPR